MALLVVNLQILAWVLLRSGRTTSSLPVSGERAALTGHTEFGIGDSTTLDSGEELPIEVWARGSPGKTSDVAAVQALLSDEERRGLRELCGRTLYHGLQNVVVSHQTGQWSFFATGWGNSQLCTNAHVRTVAQHDTRFAWPCRDLPLMWLRDSAFQIGVLLPRIRRRPSLRRVVEGGIRAQAFYILQDPYANGFYPEWRHPFEHNDMDRRLGRGGWVGVRNYELDSGKEVWNVTVACM